MASSCYAPGCNEPVIGQCLRGYKEPCGRFYCAKHQVDGLCGICYERASRDAAVRRLLDDYTETAKQVHEEKGIYRDVKVKLGLHVPQAKKTILIPLLVLVVVSAFLLYSSIPVLGCLGLIAALVLPVVAVEALPPSATLDDSWKTWHRDIRSPRAQAEVILGLIAVELVIVGLVSLMSPHPEYSLYGIVGFLVLLIPLGIISARRRRYAAQRILDYIESEKPGFKEFYAAWKKNKATEDWRKVLGAVLLAGAAIGAIAEYQKKEQIRNDVREIRRKLDSL